MQLKESQAQNGDIYVLFSDGEIKAFSWTKRKKKNQEDLNIVFMEE